MSDGEDDFPGAPTNLEFWSLEIPAGRTVEAKILDVPGMFEIVHVTGCALGENASTDRHVVKAIVTNPEGKSREVALGTLHRDRTDQFALDFGISSTTGFRHTGKSTVYLNGYLTRSYASEDEFGSEDYDMETDEDEDSDDEAPQAVPLTANGVPKGKKGVAAAESDSEEEGESESSDDESEEGESSDEEGESSDDEVESEEDQDEEGDEYDRRLGAKSFVDASASESDGEDGEDESDDASDDPLDIDPTDKVAFVKYDGAPADGPHAMDVEGDSSSEEEEGEDQDEDEDEAESDDEGEEESDSEEDDASEEAEEAPKPAAAAAAKRPPQQPMTPQVQPKRQKGQDGGKVAPASAPAKGPQAKTAGGPVERRFLENIVAELRRSGGSLPLGQLSTKVKRPAEVPKYKAFLLQHSELISVDAKDNVSVAK